MIKLIKVDIDPFKNRVARAQVKYYELTIELEVWLWQSNALFVKMPEMKIGERVVRLLEWDDKYNSDIFQKEVVAQIRDQGLSLEKALELRDKWFKKNKPKQESKNHLPNITKKVEPVKVEEPKVLNAMKGFTEVVLPKDDYSVKRKAR